MDEKENMSETDRGKVISALLRRALGYTVTETSVETTEKDGECIEKKKETTKEVPCDVAAARVLLEMGKEDGAALSALSDEQLLSLYKKLSSRLSDLLKKEKKTPTKKGGK